MRPLITGIEREAGQLLDVGVIVGADHDAVEVAREHARGVADRLAPAELDVAGGEEERVSAELEGADLEGDAGAGAALGEDHPQRLAGERLVGVVAPLHAGGEIEDGEQLGAGEVGDGEEVTWGGHGEPIVVATSRLWKSDALYSPQPNSSRSLNAEDDP